MKENKKFFKKALNIHLVYFLMVGIFAFIILWLYLNPTDSSKKMLFIQISGVIGILLIISLIVFWFIRREIGKFVEYKLLLKDEAQRFQTLFNNAQDAIIIMRNYEIVEFNNQSLQLFKCVKESFKGKLFTSFISCQQEKGEISLSEAERLIKEALMENNQSVQWIMKRCDKFPFYAEISFSTTEYGGQQYTQAIVRDISELKMSEKALKISEEKYREIVQNANIAMIKLDLSGKIIFFNNYSQKLLGYSEDEILGQEIIGKIFKEEDLKTWKRKDITYKEWVNNLVRDKEQYKNIEVWNSGKFGQRFYMEWSSIPTFDENHSFSGVLCFGTDRTEQKKALDRFIESEQRFRLFFNSVSDGISITSENGDLIEVNDVILKQFGITRQEFYSLDPVATWPVDLKRILPEIIKQAEKKDESFLEFDFKSDHGVPYQIEISTKKIIYEGKKGFLAVSREISERKQQLKRVYNAVIEAEEKERARVARELHDGVSPILSTVKLYTQSLGSCDDELLQKNILAKVEETINESIRSVSEISNNLSPHVLRNFGLETAINTFIKRISDNKTLDIQYRSNIQERLNEILEITMYRIVIELINNTIKHAQASKVRIELMKNGNLFLTYCDDGKGIDNEKYAGGMGLYNISIRVKSLNGKIDLDCSPNKGFKIKINIPLNE